MPAKSYQYFTAIWHVLANVYASRTSRRISQHPQHNVLQTVVQMHLTISRNDWRVRPKFRCFQSSSTKLPTPISSLQSIPLPLLDLLEDSGDVVLCCCTLWLQRVGLDGLVPRSWSAPGSADISWCQGGHSVFLSVRWSWPSRQRQWPGVSTTSYFWTSQLVHWMSYSLLQVLIQLLSWSQITWL